MPSSLNQVKSTANQNRAESIKSIENREKTPPMQILGLRQGFIPVLRQLAINHGALELRGKLRLLLLVLLQFKSGYAKTHIFRPPLTQGGSKHLLKEVQGVTENEIKAGN